MYKSKPWTLEEKRTRKSSYIKERQADLAISVSRVKKLFELHKEKTFTIAQISEALNLSEGTVSSIMNRLITLGDIHVVMMKRPHWAPVFQHADSAPTQVNFTYVKQDAIVGILNLFKADKNKIFTKKDILSELKCSESMLRRSLQILLLNGEIKLVGSTEGSAEYQYKTGNRQGYEISCIEDERYTKLSDYLKEKNLQDKAQEIKEILEEVTVGERIFYASTGMCKEYLKEELDKIVEKMNKKQTKKSIIKKLFS